VLARRAGRDRVGRDAPLLQVEEDPRVRRHGVERPSERRHGFARALDREIREPRRRGLVDATGRVRHPPQRRVVEDDELVETYG
jgi:hypothetical protein